MMSIAKISKDDNKYNVEVSRKEWSDATARAMSGKRKGHKVGFLNIPTREYRDKMSEATHRATGTGSLIGGTLGAAAAYALAKKFHVNEKGAAAMLGGSMGALTGMDIGSNVGRVKGGNDFMKDKGIKQSWGISDKQHMTEEAAERYMSDKAKRKLVKESGFKTEAITGGLGALYGYAGSSKDASMGEKLKNAAGFGMAGAGLGHMGKKTYGGEGFRFTSGGGGGRAGAGVGKSNPGAYGDFFKGVKDPAQAKKMFRAESRKVHPDLHPDPAKKAMFEKKQKELNAAKEMFDNKYGRG